MEQTFEDKIKAKLEELRKSLQSHGGDMELVAITGKTVKLKLKGACGGCPHAMMTVKRGIEAALKDQIDPDIVVEQA